MLRNCTLPLSVLGELNFDGPIGLNVFLFIEEKDLANYKAIRAFGLKTFYFHKKSIKQGKDGI